MVNLPTRYGQDTGGSGSERGKLERMQLLQGTKLTKQDYIKMNVSRCHVIDVWRSKHHRIDNSLRSEQTSSCQQRRASAHDKDHWRIRDNYKPQAH